MSKMPDLNLVELEILGILWDAENALKPAQIGEKLSAPLKNANLRAILSGLVEKGVLERELSGKAYFYSPTKAARTVRRNLTGKLASVFAEGSRLGLIAQLIKDEKLTAKQIEELKQIAREGTK